jgi:hypothetical protein
LPASSFRADSAFGSMSRHLITWIKIGNHEDVRNAKLRLPVLFQSIHAYLAVTGNIRMENLGDKVALVT